MAYNPPVANTALIVPSEQTTEIIVNEENPFSARPINPAQSYLISLGSEGSRSTVRSHLGSIAKLLGFEDFNQLPWEQFERQHVLTVIEMLKKNDIAPSTIRGYLSTIKGVCREAWANKQIDTDTYTHIKDVKAPRGKRISKGRALSVSEVQTLLSTCIQDRTNRGLRDTAIVAIMVGCGLRRAELTSLKCENIIFRDKAIKVLGKGNKERINYIPEFAWEHLFRWISEVRGNAEGPVFTRVRAGDDVRTNGLTVNGLTKILEYRRIDAVWIESFSPHDLRRTFASQLLEQDVDLNTVKDLMGHSSITTTQTYDQRDKKRLQKAGRNLKY